MPLELPPPAIADAPQAERYGREREELEAVASTTVAELQRGCDDRGDDLTALFDDHRVPEAVGGVERDTVHPHPGVYPKADSPQAWLASGV